MEILADEHVPEEYVSALRGDGHDVRYSREIEEFGPSAEDTLQAEAHGFSRGFKRHARIPLSS